MEIILICRLYILACAIFYPLVANLESSSYTLHKFYIYQPVPWVADVCGYKIENTFVVQISTEMGQKGPEAISVISQIPYLIWSCWSSLYSLDFSSSLRSFSFFSSWYFFKARCRFTSFSSTNFSNFTALSFVW